MPTTLGTGCRQLEMHKRGAQAAGLLLALPSVVSNFHAFSG